MDAEGKRSFAFDHVTLVSQVIRRSHDDDPWGSRSE